ncbi:hypothetical protein LTR16_008702, partial [Cryomyces antarcticus]
MSYYRSSSPSSRRVVYPERSSTGTIYDPYAPRTTHHVSPRSSNERVVPISTQTFINAAPISSSSRTTGHYDSYSGRPRRSTLTETDPRRPSVTTSYQPSRFRPAVVQSAIDRPPSPLGYSSQTIDRDYYITPAVSAPSRREHREHKKLYSVDDGKAARLVADIDTPNTSRRKDSTERGGYRSSGLGGNRKGYHLNGPLVRAADKNDDYGYSYTDAAGMYRDTEPRWRARRGSAEATGRRDRLS